MTRNAVVPVLAVLAIALFAGCGADAEPVEPADLAIVGARLIDGTGGDLVADAVILIDGGRIRPAGRAGV